MSQVFYRCCTLLIQRIDPFVAQTINESIVTAFNDVYTPATGASIALFFEPTLGSGCGGWGCHGYNDDDPNHRKNRWWDVFHWGSYDDDNSALSDAHDNNNSILMRGSMQAATTTTTTKFPTVLQGATKLRLVHSNFEDMLCGLLNASGSSNLAKANGCTVSFVHKPIQADDIICNSGEDTKAVDTQFIMQGSQYDLSLEDIDLIDKSIVAAYNEAFVPAGKAMTHFQTTGQAVGFADDVDDDSVLGDSKLLTGRFEPLCPNGDDDDDVPPSKLELMQSAFEQSICRKLVNSGNTNSNFANIDGDRFRATYFFVADFSCFSDALPSSLNNIEKEFIAFSKDRLC